MIASMVYDGSSGMSVIALRTGPHQLVGFLVKFVFISSIVALAFEEQARHNNGDVVIVRFGSTTAHIALDLRLIVT